MKALLLVLSLGVSSTVWASSVTTDCSKAADGKVMITSKEERISLKKAAEIAYECLLAKNKQAKQVGHAGLRKAKADAIRMAKNLGEARRSCGNTTEELQMITTSSWVGGRPSVGADGSAEIGDEATILVNQGIKCIGIGTGLYEGIVSSVNVTLQMSESYKFNIEDDKVPAIQTIMISLKEVLKSF